MELSDLQAEAAAMEDLLDAFYAVTYEPAVCVFSGAASPPKGEGGHRSSPRGGSPSRRNGPSAAEAAAAVAPVVPPLSREILNALLPPKYNGLVACDAMISLSHDLTACLDRGLTATAGGNVWCA